MRLELDLEDDRDPEDLDDEPELLDAPLLRDDPEDDLTEEDLLEEEELRELADLGLDDVLFALLELLLLDLGEVLTDLDDVVLLVVLEVRGVARVPFEAEPAFVLVVVTFLLDEDIVDPVLLELLTVLTPRVLLLKVLLFITVVPR